MSDLAEILIAEDIEETNRAAQTEAAKQEDDPLDRPVLTCAATPPRRRLTVEDIKRRVALADGLGAKRQFTKPASPKPEAEKPTDGGWGAAVAESRQARDEQTEAEHARAKTCVDAADILARPERPLDPLIEGLVESGAYTMIAAGSKVGKSWFSLQLACCIATGTPFLGRRVKRQRVYLADIENSADGTARRLRSMVRRLNISAEDLRGRLFIDCLRGHSPDLKWCLDETKRRGAKVAILDPLYEVFSGSEVDEGDCKEFNDEIKKFLALGLSVVVVHHSQKGFAGDRQAVDAASGSGVLVRFPENLIVLARHAKEADCRVLNCDTLRDYAAPPPCSIRLRDGAFETAPEVLPVLASSRGGRSCASPEAREAAKVERESRISGELADAVDEIVAGRGAALLSVTELQYALRGLDAKGKPEMKPRWKFGKGKVEKFVSEQISAGALKTCQEIGEDGFAKSPRRHGRKLVGRPEQVAEYAAAWKGEIG